MKLKFNPNLSFQTDAINSTLNLFEGIKTKVSSFSIPLAELSLFYDDLGIGNQIVMDNWIEIVNQNLKKIQLNNHIIVSELNEKTPIFDIEMETGTGKTYVFLRTILELNKKYDFKKFIILVPSIAIKEGVKKTLEITKEHFKTLFNTSYDFFEYKSDNLDCVKEFSQNNNIQIMIVNIQSLNKMFSSNSKSLNVMYKEMDKFNGYKPIDLIEKTNPIVIIDEPQSSASTEKSLVAINRLNPLFILRYSATFRERKNEHLIYRLNSIDAFEKNLVKKITYHGINLSRTPSIGNNLELIDLLPDKNSAKIKLNIVQKNKKISQKEVSVKVKDDLFKISNIDDYRGYLIEEINYENEYILFANNEKLTFHKKDIYSEILVKDLIKKTIELHLRKQKELLKQNIKVLSLFFIDKVSKYRIYENNLISNGEYANYFEEAFIECANQDEFKDMFVNKDIKELAKKIHNGYFSQDIKTKNFKDSKTGDSIDDNTTYKLIMKDKEKLLSFDSELSFIFSHSALREGWDNPNVFQICVLHKMGTDIKRRQEIGRGLRLCVNNLGERIYDEKINQLSIIGDETYEKFVNNFQKELEEDGIDFKKIDSYIFSKNSNVISNEQSLAIFNELKNRNIIDKNNYINNDFSIEEIKDNLTEIYEYAKIDEEPLEILELLKTKISNIIKNGNKQKINKLKNNVIKDKNFQKMLQTVLQKTWYKFKFDTNEFIDLTIKKINESTKEIENIKIIQTEANLSIKNDGVFIDNVTNYIVPLNQNQIIKMIKINNLYNFIDNIKNATFLTKKTIVKIIQKICFENEKIYQLIFENIASFQNLIIDKINKSKMEIILKNIEYKIWDDNKFSESDILVENMQIYENDLLLDLTDDKLKCPHEYIQCDSYIEKNFGKDSLQQKNILNFLKLPLSFKISTPVGNYTPDWLAFYKSNNEIEIITIVETKGTDDKTELRYKEKAKIDCAIKHFDLLDSNLKKLKIYFNTTKNLKDFLLKMDERKCT